MAPSVVAERVAYQGDEAKHAGGHRRLHVNTPGVVAYNPLSDAWIAYNPCVQLVPPSLPPSRRKAHRQS